MDHHTEPDETTKSADRAGHGDQHAPGRPATEGESAAADEQYAKGSDAHRAEVAKHEKEMMEIGAEVKGEGAID